MLRRLVAVFLETPFRAVATANKWQGIVCPLDFRNGVELDMPNRGELGPPAERLVLLRWGTGTYRFDPEFLVVAAFSFVGLIVSILESCLVPRAHHDLLMVFEMLLLNG